MLGTAPGHTVNIQHQDQDHGAPGGLHHHPLHLLLLQSHGAKPDSMLLSRVEKRTEISDFSKILDVDKNLGFC